MEEIISGEIIYTIIITIIVCVVLTVAILGLIYLTYKNRKQFELEKAALETKKTEEINRVKMEIKNETLYSVANELHDNIGQILALMRISIKSLKKRIHDEKIDGLDELSENALNDVRNLSYELKSGLREDFELEKALINLLKDISRSCDIRTEIKKNHELHTWDRGEQLILYRICQEFISNSIKHSRADLISIEIDSDENACIIKLSDNGIGFNPDTTRAGSGIGNMWERAELVNADLAYDRAKKSGTELKITKSRTYE